MPSGMISIKKPWTSKPPVGTALNLFHPMAKDLIFFCAMDRHGDQVDLVNNKIGASIDTGSGNLTTRKPTPGGIVAEIQGANDVHTAGWDFGDTNSTSQIYEPTELTIIAQVRMDEFIDEFGQRIVSKRTSATGSDDWAIFTGAFNNEYRFRVNGPFDTIVKSSGDYVGKLIDIALSIDTVNHHSFVWDLTDNVFDTITPTAGLTVNQSDGNLCVGHRQAENRTWDGDIHYVALFNKKKQQAFIEVFRKNPWQIFEPRRVLIPVGVEAAAAPAPLYTHRHTGMYFG